jgi:GT2 family glycosyltransferase
MVRLLTDVTCIAVVLTCHNRRVKTLECLHNVYKQKLQEGASFRVFLTDDGSTDGTFDAVAVEFPDVSIIRGGGSLYWCGGMRVAWKAAIQEDQFDYFLWLNDDTLLKPGAIADMLDTARKEFGIIVGSCHDPETEIWTYGGRATGDGKKSLAGTPVLPGSTVQRCQQMNGNVVLVPKAVVDRIGILSDAFTHAIGDFDYGFRALDAGIPLIVPPHYQATCSSNPMPAWCNPGTPFHKRLALFNNPKGIYFSEFMVFCYRHFGLKCILIGAKVIIRLLLPGLWRAGEGVKA